MSTTLTEKLVVGNPAIIRVTGTKAKIEYTRGQIVMVDLGKSNGSVQGGTRPCVVIQNDIGNRFAPTTIVAPLTSKLKKEMPTHVYLKGMEYDNRIIDSIVLCEQIKVIPRDSIRPGIVATLNRNDMEKLNKAAIVSLGLQI
ncbi:MAG: type II toxin-antitoxin system PemK/MazF family toxin [Cellulosilyticaceae bacterium]